MNILTCVCDGPIAPVTRVYVLEIFLPIFDYCCAICGKGNTKEIINYLSFR